MIQVRDEYLSTAHSPVDAEGRIENSDIFLQYAKFFSLGSLFGPRQSVLRAIPQKFFQRFRFRPFLFRDLCDLFVHGTPRSVQILYYL